MPSFAKPRPFPILCTLTAFALLVTLGTWQMKRMVWKEAIIANVHTKMQEEPVQLPIRRYDAEALEFRKVTAEGTFLYGKEIFLYQSRGKQSGYAVITPLMLADNSPILVNRGWIPMDMRQDYRGSASLADETVVVEGMLQKGETQGMFVPDNNIGKNVWFWLDIEEAKRLSGLDYPPLFIRATGVTAPKEYPIKNDLVINIRNDHLHYAVTWYILAIAVVVIFVLYHRKDTPRYPMKL